MRQFNKFRGTKGFISLWEQMIRFRYMITEEAEERTRILAFWKRHALNKKSTTPKKKRKRIIPGEVRGFIARERRFDPHLSKDKLSILMRQDGVANLSASTVGRM